MRETKDSDEKRSKVDSMCGENNVERDDKELSDATRPTRNMGRKGGNETPGEEGKTLSEIINKEKSP